MWSSSATGEFVCTWMALQEPGGNPLVFAEEVDGKLVIDTVVSGHPGYILELSNSHSCADEVPSYTVTLIIEAE